MKKRIPPGQPSKDTFVQFAREKKIDAQLAGDQWDIWDAGDWCDGNGTPILNWKSKLATFSKRGFGMFRPTRMDDMQQQQQKRMDASEKRYEDRQRHIQEWEERQRKRGDAV